ncbi:hypothetical protein HGH93_14085 [Chitinophaga polysaccharea]|uniref:hypothetical protein n=1 Tax=Chitinophaga TaxID=79328 RepID=UPI001454F3DC|nr:MULTISPECIES: hypothetical protein [Chitinophaga]NLR59241.1 hypothetical protein [Chitinophaga polysaccharea]NLU91990.1 hypothetical protein [Chitinophaga sp. Ak27]
MKIDSKKNLLICLLLLPVFLFGQNRKTKEEIIRPFLREFKLPRDMADCTTFFTTIEISIKSNKIQANFVSSKGCPKSLRDEIKRCFGFLDIKHLTKDYFGISQGTSYNILFPLVIHPDQYCPDSITPQTFRSILTDGFDIQVKGPVYLMDALIIGTSKTISKNNVIPTVQHSTSSHKAN